METHRDITVLIPLDYPVVQEAAVVLPLVLAIGLALLARLLFKPKEPTPIRDDKPTTATQRGAFVPLVIGTRQVGAVVLWVGGREIVQESTGGGGKGIGGGGGGSVDVFFEQGVHALAIGPGARISGIYADGKLLPNSTGLNKLTAPSGTLITFGDRGSARVYWGEPDQPISAMFTAELGIATRVPYVIRVEWDRIRLGRNPRWPIIEYVVEPTPVSANASPPVTAIIQDADEKGINPAHAIWQIITAPFPWGGGLPTEWLDYVALVKVGDLAVTEGISMNILVQDGDPVNKVLGEVLQDDGVLLPACQGVLAPFALRKFTDPIETLTDDLLLPPVEEIEKIHKSLLGDALIYEYADAEQKFRTATIDIDDDSVGAIRNQRKTKKIPLPTITHRPTASKVVNRRSIEDLDTITAIKITGLRALRHAVSGQPFSLPGVGVVRVLATKVDFESPKVKLDLIKDPFDRSITTYVDPDLPDQSLPVGDLEPDIRFIAIEIPRLLSNSTNAIAVARHRANSSITGANILASGDNISYEHVGSQAKTATGGLVETDWRLPRIGYITTVTPLRVTIDATGDENNIVNLASVPSEWVRGGNFMVVFRPAVFDDLTGGIIRKEEWELFYIQNFSLVSGNIFQVTGIIANRFNTRETPIVQRFHDHELNMRIFLATDNCEVYIIARNDMTPGSGGIVELGGVQHVKSQPINAQGTLPAAAIINFPLAFTNEAIRPLRPAWAGAGGNYNVLGGLGDLSNDYTDDATFLEDLVIEFLLSDPTHGAGQQGAGQATPAEELAGFIHIDVYWAAVADGFYRLEEDITGDANIAIVGGIILPASTPKNARGNYEWRYTRTQRLADGIDDANNDYGGPSDNPLTGTPFAIMQIRIRHEIAGVFSDPIMLRPVSVLERRRFYSAPH